MAIGSDRIAQHGVSGNSCYSTASFGGPNHSNSWTYLKPICGPIGGTGSPIIIDAQGEGFHLTSAADGVLFRERPEDAPIQLSWTDPGYHNGWLALPHDGQVRALSDLFGNFTPQPPSDHPNGYAALALYDLNRDGVIDMRDPIYTSLRIWIDANHDGVSQSEELHTLAELHIESISLRFHETRRTDQYGNQFRYTASADIDNAGRQDDRSFDVFLVSKQ